MSVADPQIADWDPKPSERVYYRSTQTGDLGYIVRRDGADKIRLDRHGDQVIRPFRGSDWVLENEHRPLILSHVAQVCLAADIKLCSYLGFHKLTKRTWLDMSESARIAWMDQGPGKNAHPKRRELYQKMMEVLAPMAK